MTNDALMRRLRAAKPAAVEHADHQELFGRIIAEPGDPRLVRASPRRLSRLVARKARRWIRPRSGVLAASTLGLAGLAAALVFALSGTAAPPAFAITKMGDGAVLVTINQLVSLPDANRQLTVMGIHEQVTIDMASGAAAGNGPVDCVPAPRAKLSGPPLKVLVTGLDSYHLRRCVTSVGSTISDHHQARTARAVRIPHSARVRRHGS